MNGETGGVHKRVQREGKEKDEMETIYLTLTWN
jgi:hypothetical protein